MLAGHLTPVGPLATAAQRHWSARWPRWTRALPWAAAGLGAVFPDLDIIVNLLVTGHFYHLYYFPHSLFVYVPVLLLGWLLARGPRTRCAGLTLLTFGAGVLSHLLLDVVSHGTPFFYPLYNGPIGWTFPDTGEPLLIAYARSPNVWLEVLTIIVGLLWVGRRLRLLVLQRPDGA
jgi:hypothetical protein